MTSASIIFPRFDENWETGSGFEYTGNESGSEYLKNGSRFSSNSIIKYLFTCHWKCINRVRSSAYKFLYFKMSFQGTYRCCFFFFLSTKSTFYLTRIYYLPNFITKLSSK